ncbi:unnamed protein product [Caenorhabditis bovis]|uniref:Class II aldolase/adducin N-terminal domain-containing protein n=1 Tax=Caenorhabditis bovis TaxID=2654633 RepID=A0A8S1EM42_9PELO|nr:unnamed protein product [Caenorhabditis bovis]
MESTSQNEECDNEQDLLKRYKTVANRHCFLFDDAPLRHQIVKLMLMAEHRIIETNELPPELPEFYPCEVYPVEKRVDFATLCNDNLKPWNSKKRAESTIRSKTIIHYYKANERQELCNATKDDAEMFLKINSYTLPRCQALKKKIYQMFSTVDGARITPSVVLYTFDGTEPVPRFQPTKPSSKPLDDNIRKILEGYLKVVGPEQALRLMARDHQIPPEGMPTISQAKYCSRLLIRQNNKEIIREKPASKMVDYMYETPIDIPNEYEVASTSSDEPPTKMFSDGVLATSTVPNPDFDAILIPIADIPDDSTIPVDERALRNQLASLYRLVDRFKWSQAIYNHITVRLPGDHDEILINPFGMFYNEVTASSLIKVNLEGNVIDQGSTNFAINQAGYVLHSAIHAARREVQCVIHLHHPSVVAVSAMKCGFLPISQEAMIVGPVAYHDFCGILVNEAEKVSIVEDLGEKNVMILRNHGFVVAADSIEHAFSIAFHLVIACETQVKCTPNGDATNLHRPSQQAIDQAYQVASGGAGGVNRRDGEVRAGNWKKGELEWQAYMRALDRMGLQTGHRYR